MGLDWRGYDGCLTPSTPPRNWMTGLRTQGDNECVAYGTLAALESMLKIHHYNDAARELDLSEDYLLTAMGTERSVTKACDILMNNGIIIPDRMNAYKIAGCLEINSIGLNSVESIIEAAKNYIRINGPIIAKYSDEVVGDHCIAIVGYTEDGKWICKDSWPLQSDGVPYSTIAAGVAAGATGGYREIVADNMIRIRSGMLYAILIQKLNIKIRHNATPTTPITEWWKVLLEIKKKIDGSNYVPLAKLDPTHVSRFQAENPAYKVRYCYPPGPGSWLWGLYLEPKAPNTNLDNLKVDVGPAEYRIRVHVCSNQPKTNENWEGPTNVGDSDTPVEILVAQVNQCAQQILYPFALDAMKRLEDEKADINVALRLLLRTSEITKEEFIEYLNQRLVELDKAHGYGSNGALEIRHATEEIRKLVMSLED